MFYFSTKKATETGNLEANQAQWDALSLERNSSAEAVAAFIARARNVPVLDAANAVDDIKRLYKAYDQTVLAEFQPNTEFTLLNDLMGLSRSVRIDESVYEYARKGGGGVAHTSMSGQVGALLEASAYSFDGTMVPIHDTGFKFTWRDPIFGKGSALASLSDAQKDSVDTVRRKYLDFIWNGFRDAAGNFIAFDGKTFKGLRSDERVAQVTLNINFASEQDGKKIRTEIIKLRDVLKLQNLQYGEQTWYVSGEILSNWESVYFDVNQTRTILEEIKKITGIKDIKEDYELKGNEVLIVPLGAGVIAPIVGQAFGTVADPRQFYNSDYVWRTWGAAGLMVKQDIAGHFSVIHAKGA
ncbi:major capsid protein [Providencia rettgeri]|uniref:major capsid protein n=1 Tax=Providencia rettgeri TaxID=587 RepID=UPI0018C5AD6D|nr:major capsid protein [Providencia rettgeri]MBG5923159.1 phage coat protein [Providencia rettgeri]